MRGLYPIVTVIVLLGLWELSVAAFDIPGYLLPPPTEIAGEIGERSESLVRNGAATLYATLLGFGLSVLVAVPLAVAIVAWERFERAVYPVLLASQTVPKVAIAPLFVVWLGFGILPRTLVAFLIAFFPIVIACIVGLQSADKEVLQLLRSMGASSAQQFLKVRIPSALPSIFGGLKVGITFSVIGAVVGEFVGSDSGLGYLLIVATGQLNTNLVFAALTVLTVMGIVLFYAVEVVERYALRRHPPARGDQAVTATL